MRLILASASPRRQELLNVLGLKYDVILPPDPIDEDAILFAPGGLDANLHVLALAKGTDIAKEHPAAVVLSADTVVVLDGEVLGKPADADEAAAMLSRLSGKVHEVKTCVALQCALRGQRESELCLTRVQFAALTKDQIARYIELTHPYDKAAGYAIQGIGALIVERIEGDYTNVVGLPLKLTAEMLAAQNIPIPLGI